MPSFEEVRSGLLESSSLFEDEEFPADKDSIVFKETQHTADWAQLEWKRPNEICSDPEFIVGGASKFDIDQGALGNCWYLSAVSVLATRPELFNKVVPSDQSFKENYAGIFRFNFWRFGKWQEVLVDDRLPTRNGKLVFCKSREQSNEFWSALLEKAYAKIHYSYQSLEAGFSHDALVDFTGGIGEAILMKDYIEKTDKLFKILYRTMKMNSLMCANIAERKGGAVEQKLESGLVSTHAYSITNTIKFDKDGQTIRLIRCLNPWGYREWNGAWSDSSDEWNSITDEEKEKFDLKVSDDGEFWMPFEEFVKNFEEVQICHLSPGSISRTKSGSKNDWNVVLHHGQWIKGICAGGCGAPPNQGLYWTNPQYYVKLQDVDEGDENTKCTLVVSLIQKYRRRMKTLMKDLEGTEVPIGFDILRCRGEEPEEIDNADPSQLRIERKMVHYEFQRERSSRYELDPGSYYIMPLTYAPDTEAEFLLRIASLKPVSSGEVDSSSGPTEDASEGKGKKKRFDKLFDRFAGDDGVLDARELKKMLNKNLRQEDAEEYSKETSRALIKQFAIESKGLLTKEECKLVWDKVRELQDSFEEYDADESGELSRQELRKAFRAAGFGLSKKTIAYIATHFCGKQGGLSFDDFVLLSSKTQVLYERFHKLAEREGSETVSGLAFDEWLEETL